MDRRSPAREARDRPRPPLPLRRLAGLRRRAGWAGWAGAALGAVGLGLLLLGLPLVPEAAPPPARAPAITSQGLTSAPVVVAGGTHAATLSSDPPRSEPVHLDIPRIGVHTDVTPTGLNPDGTVGVPPLDAGAPAGWYRYLASPGDPGPAVLLGHVDTYRGPAVFYRIHDLRPGDAIRVERADGRTVDFAVDSVRTYPKTEFPAQTVYGHTTEPVLWLVTCGGMFDRDSRTYLSNVVVYASLVPRGGRFPRGVGP